MSSTNNQRGVLLEDMDSKFDRLIEVVSGLRDELRQKADKEDIDTLMSDVRIIKAAVTDTSRELQILENRVVRLEN